MEHMSELVIEYAGGANLQQIAESRAAAVARAPAWVREGHPSSSSRHSGPPRESARPPAPKAAARQIAGWLAGCACPGVSVPAYSKKDGQTLREQFTPRCVAGFVEQWRRGEQIPVTWKHGGPVLASNPLDVWLRQNELVGLVFGARLDNNPLARLALEQLTGDGVGVSIGYYSDTAEQWHTQRDGFGTIRVVDRARLAHIALIPAASNMAPAYRGARAFGVVGARVGCPAEVRWRAEYYAYVVVKEQAGQLLDAKQKAALV